jgi:Trk K+ transport system NAD-binding subunit
MSEFSLVIASLGVTYKHIGEETVGIAIYAMAITAVLSSYGIRYNHQIYRAFERLLSRKGAAAAVTAAEADGGNGHGSHRPVVLLGVHRGARALIDGLAQRAPDALTKMRLIDFNTEVIREMRERGINGTFGDLGSLDTLEHAHLHHAKMILSTIPDMLLKGTDNQTLVKACRALAPHATIVATADNDRHEQVLRAEGADFVVNPNVLAGDLTAALVVAAVTEQPGEEVAERVAAADEAAHRALESASESPAPANAQDVHAVPASRS